MTIGRKTTVSLACTVFAVSALNVSAQEKPVGVLIAVGDITSCPPDPPKTEDPIKGGKATAILVAEQIKAVQKDNPNAPVAILLLGDIAYDCGSTRGFGCFETHWGVFRDKELPNPLPPEYEHKVLPVPGNHEYDAKRGNVPNERCLKRGETAAKGEKHAKPYFAHFERELTALRASNGYYSVDFAKSGGNPWRIVAINSNTGVSEQVAKLKSDLQDAKKKNIRCIIAFAHAPYYSSGRHGHGQNSVIDLKARLKPEHSMKAIFEALHQGGASAFLAGHDHHYEQLGQANANAVDSDKGKSAMMKSAVRSFVVGTGGKSLHSSPRQNGKDGNLYDRQWAFIEEYNLKDHGILRIDLYQSSYQWRFIPVDGSDDTVVVRKNDRQASCRDTNL